MRRLVAPAIVLIATSCALFTPKNARTVLDDVQIACIIANATLADDTVAEICAIDNSLTPILRDLLSKQRAQLARTAAHRKAP